MLFIVATVTAGLIAVWVGIPVLVATIGVARRLAEHRREIGRVCTASDRVPVPAPPDVGTC